jgi:integration host factor subunit beta
MVEKAIDKVMTRSDVMNRLSKRLSVDIKVAEQIVKTILEKLSEAISGHERIEIRGFGSFEVRHRTPRQARNPKTGQPILTSDRYTVHFKPGKELRQRVNNKK